MFLLNRMMNESTSPDHAVFYIHRPMEYDPLSVSFLIELEFCSKTEHFRRYKRLLLTSKVSGQTVTSGVMGMTQKAELGFCP